MRTNPASRLTLGQLSEFWNLAYSGYFVPVSFTEPILDRWIRQGALHLDHSPVLMDGQTFVGCSFLGIRHHQGWIGGFGVAPNYRGRGIAGRLFAEQMDCVREQGFRHVQLEVLSQNWAQKVYARAGFEPSRTLAVLEGVPSVAEPPAAPVHAGDADHLLLHHQRLHSQSPACWQREVAYLTAVPGLSPLLGICTGPKQDPGGYLLYVQHEKTVRIVDGAALEADDASALIGYLAHQYPGGSIACVNEPTDSLLHQAMLAAGIRQRETQIEMHWNA